MTTTTAQVSHNISKLVKDLVSEVTFFNHYFLHSKEGWHYLNLRLRKGKS